jgi:hypothetical protein
MIVVCVIFALVVLVYVWSQHRSRIQYNGDHSWLVIQPVKNATEIPRVIHQTYKSKHLIHPKVAKNMALFAPGYERKVYDDDDIKKFLQTHFHPRVLQAFSSLQKGAHKADLFRYCVLYIEGGIYMDIKTELIQNIDGLFANGRVTTVVSRTESEIYQGLIAAPPKQPIFLALIDGILKSGPNPPYNLFIREFRRYIQQDCGGSRLDCKKHSYTLYKEVCTTRASDCEDGLDRYGICCNIFDKESRVIKTRYADFPWNSPHA